VVRCSRSLAIATAMLIATLAMTGAASAHIRYPYTLVDPGTFGGPSSYIDEPDVPFTDQGVLVGVADTSTPDSGSTSCPANFCDGYAQRGFAWRNGRLTEFAPLPGFTDSDVFELNDEGVAAGTSLSDLDPNTLFGQGLATIWRNGQPISLGTLPGGTRSFAQDVNDRGQVAGMSSNEITDPLSFFGWGTETRGFIWQHGVMTDLGSLGGPDTIQNNLNGAGQIAGMSYVNDTVNPATGLPTIDPFLWQNGHMTDLGTLGGTFGAANWLSDDGFVVGQSDVAGDQAFDPFLWAGHRMIDLGTLGGDFGSATSVNDSGDVAGWSALPGDNSFAGFLWHHGRMTELAPVGGASSASANRNNDSDQVVGNENDADGNEIIAALWSGGHGYDLNTLVAPTSLHMTSAEYIDDRGDIVAHGVYPNGDARMFLLVRDPSVPLPDASPTRPALPGTGQPDEHPSQVFATSGAGRNRMAAGIRQMIRDNSH
jgi:probable HAF family extracellular repeat protein